jgi:hypothetical protein
VAKRKDSEAERKLFRISLACSYNKSTVQARILGNRNLRSLLFIVINLNSLEFFKQVHKGEHKKSGGKGAKTGTEPTQSSPIIASRGTHQH